MGQKTDYHIYDIGDVIIFTAKEGNLTGTITGFGDKAPYIVNYLNSEWLVYQEDILCKADKLSRLLYG